LSIQFAAELSGCSAIGNSQPSGRDSQILIFDRAIFPVHHTRYSCRLRVLAHGYQVQVKNARLVFTGDICISAIHADRFCVQRPIRLQNGAPVHLAGFSIFAHLFFCAAAILARASALSLRLPRFMGWDALVVVCCVAELLPVSVRMRRTSLSRAISSSIATKID
jgi:hypothetical protein